jgi:hypothetical protein
MFAVLFEVHPKAEEWDAYLSYAKLLRPELERIDAFGSSATTGCMTGGRLHSTARMHRIGIPLSRRGEKRG